jgi:predicted RNase H-like HicB family nuclease
LHDIQYQIVIYWSKDDDAFIAEVPDLAGCTSDGNSYAEAAANAEDAARAWIETALEMGRAIPAPTLRRPTLA